MKVPFLGSKGSMSRREFLMGIQPRHDVIPVIDKEKCTGCGLCTMDCPEGAFILLQSDKEDTYQLVFRHDLCDACGHCEESCPEKCLQLEQGPEPGRLSKETKVIFEDKISRCTECGIPLFPQAMVNRLKPKIIVAAGLGWPFNLCPSCRIRTQFGKEMAEKSKA